MGSRHRPGTAPGPADDRPSSLRAPAGDPTPITQVKVRTRTKSITGFSLSKPVPGFKTGYRFSGSRLTSLVIMKGMILQFMVVASGVSSFVERKISSVVYVTGNFKNFNHITSQASIF